MKKTRKLLSILLALVMALSLCTVAFAVDDPEVPVFSGTCGENIAWTIENGVLTVTGTGAIEAIDGSFPWTEAVMAYFFGLYGVESEEEFFGLVNSGEASMAEVDAFLRAIVSKIVIGEGITSIADEAFYMGEAAEIELPATLATIGEGAFDLRYATSLTIKNAAFNFEENPIDVYGAIDYPEIVTMTLDDYIAQMFGKQDAYMNNMPFVSAYLSAGALAQLEYYKDAFEAAVEAGGMTEAQANQNFGSMADTFLSVIMGYYFPYFTDQVAETVEDAVAIVLDFFNENYGNEEQEIFFEELADIAVYDAETEEATPSEKIAAVAPEGTAAVQAVMSDDIELSPYQLGTAPVQEGIDPETEEPIEVALTPVPWLTVYGPYNSTARTACATSKVKFVSFEEQEFDAYKVDAAAAAAAKAADGDSDASKKLIADAQAAINALAYDGTKTLAENKAAVDAINAKLDTDLAAQREADKPVVPEEKPDDKPADNDKDEDGGYSNNAFMKFIKKIIEFFKGIFEKITGIFKK